MSISQGRTDPAAASPPTATDDDLLALTDLSVHYHLRRGLLSRSTVEIQAVDHVSLSIRHGQTLGLVGGTGSGKSTIAQVVMGMVHPTSGSVRIAGEELGTTQGAARLALQRMVQVVLQDPYSSLDPRMKVGDIIAEPLTVRRPGTPGMSKTEMRARVNELLALVGFAANKAELYPHQFSGGQRQRIAVARALAPKPALIVLDEPTSALDVSVRAQILNLLRTIQEQLGVTYLVISHDLVTVSYLASTIAVMFLGRIVELGPTLAILRAPHHPYTLELLDSVPGASGAFLNQPRPTASTTTLPPTACPYASRCAMRTRLGDPERCLAEQPTLAAVGQDHSAACHFADQVERLAETIV